MPATWKATHDHTTTTLIRLLYPCMLAAFWPELYLTELPLHCLPRLALPFLHASDCSWTACDAKRISRRALQSSIGVDSTCLWLAEIDRGPQPKTSPRHWEFKLEPHTAQIVVRKGIMDGRLELPLPLCVHFLGALRWKSNGYLGRLEPIQAIVCTLVVQGFMTIGMLCGLLFLRREFRWMRADLHHERQTYLSTGVITSDAPRICNPDQ